ncbi:MAG: hypothetical protein V7631_3997 [Massilia sp.]|jgi:hypothetical protein
MGTQGGVMWKEVTVKNGESIEGMLTNKKEGSNSNG